MSMGHIDYLRNIDTNKTTIMQAGRLKVVIVTQPSSFIQIRISFKQECFVQSLVKISPVVLE